MTAKERKEILVLGCVLFLLAALAGLFIYNLRVSHFRQYLERDEVETEERAIQEIEAMAERLDTAEGEARRARDEAERMLRAERERMEAEREESLRRLNERLIEQDAARARAEAAAAELRNRLDSLEIERAELERQRRIQEAEAEARATQSDEAEVREREALAAAQSTADLAAEQRREAMANRRAAIEAAMREQKAQEAEALARQIELEEAILQAGGSLTREGYTIRSPHNRRREAIRLREQIERERSSN